MRPAVSVGFGGLASDAKVASVPALFHPSELAAIDDGGNFDPFFDFTLFSEGSSNEDDGLFGASIEAGPTDPFVNWLQGPPQDPYEGVDVSDFLDLHAGSGATTSVGDEPGIAAEAEHQFLTV